MPAFASDGWDNVYKSYDNADYGKIVPENEYKNAVNALKKYNKQNKKVKKKLQEAGLASDKKEHKKKLIFEIPASPQPLFTLPINIDYNGKLIKKGFYLAKAINKNDKYFIRLTQGEGKIIADIAANVFKFDNMAKISDGKEKIASKITKNNMLKITFNNSNFILEAYLRIQ